MVCPAACQTSDNSADHSGTYPHAWESGVPRRRVKRLAGFGKSAFSNRVTLVDKVELDLVADFGSYGVGHELQAAFANRYGMHRARSGSCGSRLSSGDRLGFCAGSTIITLRESNRRESKQYSGESSHFGVDVDVWQSVAEKLLVICYAVEVKSDLSDLTRAGLLSTYNALLPIQKRL